MPEPLALAAVCAELVALGWASGVAWPGPTPPWWVQAALRLLAGVPLLAVALLLAALAGLSLKLMPVVAAGALALAALVRLAAARRVPPAGPPRLGRGELLAWSGLAALLAAAFARAWLVPEAGWDAYSHWGLKAKAYFLAGSIVGTDTAHEYYPPLVPLLEAWLFLHLGQASLDFAKVLWSVVGSAFAVCLSWHLRLALRGTTWAAPLLGAAVVLASTGLLEGFFTGQGDLALTSFLTLGTLALFQIQGAAAAAAWRPWLVQVALFGAAAALSKYEGLFRVGVVAAVVGLEWLLCRRRWLLLGGLAWALAAAAASLPWVVFRATRGIEVTGEHLGPPQWSALPAVLAAIAATLGGVRTGGGLVVGVAAVSLAGRRLLAPPLRLPLLVVVGQVVATLAAFLLTASPPVQQVALAGTRLVSQFAPVLLFLGALAVVGAAAGESPAGADTAPPARGDTLGRPAAARLYTGRSSDS